MSNENGNDETVDTQDTSHDDGNDGLHDQFRLQDTHAADTNTTLSSTISSTQILNLVRRKLRLRLTGKDKGGRDTDETKEIRSAIENSVTSLSREGEDHV